METILWRGKLVMEFQLILKQARKEQRKWPVYQKRLSTRL
jgi:hypothetical protein